MAEAYYSIGRRAKANSSCHYDDRSRSEKRGMSKDAPTSDTIEGGAYKVHAGELIIGQQKEELKAELS